MEILYQEPIMALTSACQVLAILLLIVGAVSFIICLASVDKRVWKPAGIITIIVLFITGGLFIWGPKVETGRHKYMVQFDEDSSFVEVYEKYEVLEQRGNVWTIQDKEIE